MQSSCSWMTVLFLATCWSRGLETVHAFSVLSNTSIRRSPMHRVNPNPNLAPWFQFQYSAETGQDKFKSWSSSCLFVKAVDDDDEEDESTSQEEVAVEDQEEKSILQKINAFLDTPVLDANNLSNEGPLKEALKGFVRDEPDLAQITFSVLVVIILVALIRLVNLIH